MPSSWFAGCGFREARERRLGLFGPAQERLAVDEPPAWSERLVGRPAGARLLELLELAQELLSVGPSLAQLPPQRLLIGFRAEIELEEQEIPPLAGVERRLLHPFPQRLPAGIGDRVDRLVGPRVLDDSLLRRVARVDELRQRGVDLRLRRRPEVRDAPLDVLPQVVPGHRPLPQQPEEGRLRRRQHQRSAAASTGSRPAKKSAAEVATGTLGWVATRVSSGEPMYMTAVETVIPRDGIGICAESPHWLGDPPVGSPTNRALVKRSTSPAKFPAAENVRRPIRTRSFRALLIRRCLSAWIRRLYGVLLPPPFRRTATITRRTRFERASRISRLGTAPGLVVELYVTYSARP